MDRRSFLKTSALGAAAVGATALAAPAIAQGRQEWKMVTTWPKNFPGLGTGAQRCADRITKMTDGRITVKLYGAGELVPAFESFDAVSNGTAEMYHGVDYYWQGKHPAFNFFATVPMGLTAPEQNAWLMFGGGQQLWDELSAGFGVKPFPCGNTGVQMGGWFREPIESLEDLKGLKMRMPGLGGEALRKLGVNVIALPGGEIFAALQSGAIDATEWVGPWNDLAFGFYRIAKNYYYPGFHEPGPTLSAGVNLDKYNALSETDKAIVENACIAENGAMYAEFVAKNGQALTTLVNQHGVTLRKFPDEVFQGFADASEEVVAEAAKHDDLAKRTYESFMKARKEYAAWTDISIQGYANERSRTLKLGE
ncbi:TRAP transporter substrate-binding protein [Acuticoccus sp. MNP-M23]|uniref:TRAP transporter substrate-binding protein n=1 Tax=Acuticoccus sp. MNP-M23 TaxID=3072793 RepID=UPI002815B788|nr:TRAP transporter substrate-binding protein [Acuticoccus sp. MNP-M23]WMS41099.1 TRAP transporter substrate-binding protein [Acuticoccus sp. MNP-M23]